MKIQNFYKVLLISGFLVITSACKKDAGKHCPVMIEDRTSQHADLSAVKDIPAIMDSLAAHPELNPYRVNLIWGIADPKIYTALVDCHIYYKDVIIFDKDYVIYASNEPYPYNLNNHSIQVNELSVNPSVNREKAESIALDAIKFDHCPSSTLGIMDFSSDKTPAYKLVWRVREVEDGYPEVLLDAQTGEVYSTNDGWIID